MSTALATMPENGIQPVTQIDHATLEKLVATGDLSGLTASQRTMYYQARCNACGLDPASQPFEYLKLNGKLILYAKKTATDQLTRLHGISIAILDRRLDHETGVYEVTCRATFPDGRIGEDVAALYMGNLKGEALSNNIMKCVTKAKRRTVLAACGLGMLDETEVDSIPAERKGYGPNEHVVNGEVIDEHRPSPSPTGKGSGMFTKEHTAKTKEFNDWITSQCQRINKIWQDGWEDIFQAKLTEGFEVPTKVDDVINPWQSKNHLFKWAVDCEYLPAPAADSDPKTRQTDALVASVFADHKAAVVAEMGQYIKKQRDIKESVIFRKNPNIAPEGYFGDPEPADDAAIEQNPEPSDDAFPEGRA